MALREAGIRRCPRRCFTCRPTTRSTHNTCPSLRAVPDLVARSHQDMERTIRGQVRRNPDWLQRAPGLPCQRACMDHVWVYCRNCDGIHSAEPPVGPCASNHVDALRRWLPLDPVSAQLCQCGVGLWRLARVAVPRLRSPGRSCLGQGTQRRAPESLVVLSIWWGASDRPAFVYWLPRLLTDATQTTSLGAIPAALLFIFFNLHHYAVDASIWRFGGQHIGRITGTR